MKPHVIGAGSDSMIQKCLKAQPHPEEFAANTYKSKFFKTTQNASTNSTLHSILLLSFLLSLAAAQTPTPACPTNSSDTSSNFPSILYLPIGLVIGVLGVCIGRYIRQQADGRQLQARERARQAVAQRLNRIELHLQQLVREPGHREVQAEQGTSATAVLDPVPVVRNIHRTETPPPTEDEQLTTALNPVVQRSHQNHPYTEDEQLTAVPRGINI